MDDLLAHSVAKVFLIAGLAVIGERQHQDRVPAHQCGSDGTPGSGGLQKLENRSVTAFRQVDYKVVIRAFLAVIASQLGPEPPCLNAHDGVVPWVESVVLSKNLHADHELLQALSAAGDGGFHNKS